MSQSRAPWPTSERWKRSVLARMEAIGMTRADLGRRIGTSNATTTTMFQPEASSSRLVPEVHAAIGWPPPPSPESAIDRCAELDDLWPLLTDEDRAAVLAVAKALAKKSSYGLDG